MEEGDGEGEFGIVLDGHNLIRFKIYGKTAERLTSTGVIDTQPRDPLTQLLLGRNDQKNRHNRAKVHHKGQVASRLEFSFYGDVLMKQ